MGKLPAEGLVAVSAGAVAAALAIATEGEERTVPRQCLVEEHAFQVLFRMKSSSGALSAIGNDRQYSVHRPSIIYTGSIGEGGLAGASQLSGRGAHYLSFGRSTAAVSTDIHGIPRPCPRRSTDNRGHSPGYRGPSMGFHGHFMGFHGMPRQVAEHRGGPWR